MTTKIFSVAEMVAAERAADASGVSYETMMETAGRRVAEELGVEFLGEIPIDPRVVEGGDQGRPIPENDVWIAALARQHELPIVSRDEHFDDVPGVERLAW